MSSCFTSVRLMEPLKGAAFLYASGEGGMDLMALEKQNSDPSPVSRGPSYPTAAPKQRAVRSESASANVKSHCLGVSPSQPLVLWRPPNAQRAPCPTEGAFPHPAHLHAASAPPGPPGAPACRSPCTVHLPSAADSILWVVTAFGAVTWGEQGQQAGRQAGRPAGGGAGC